MPLGYREWARKTPLRRKTRENDDEAGKREKIEGRVMRHRRKVKSTKKKVR